MTAGFVPTLNRKGYMRVHVDAYMEAFVAFAAACSLPVADIGAAYGVATIPALEAGATVIAVDLDERHLQILERRVRDRGRLRTIRASFPEDLHLDEESLGAVLLSSVAHFLTPDRLELGARRLFEWLAPGGRVFVTATSPYVGECRSFLPEYESRKRAGHPWPGYVTDVPKYAPDWTRHFSTLLLLDPETLSRVFRQSGFTIERSELHARPDIPPAMQLDGREEVGLIARKLRHQWWCLANRGA